MTGVAHDLVHPPKARRGERIAVADVNAAFADPAIRGILAVVGGEDQITVIPHLDAQLARRDPKPFLGTSDNTDAERFLAAGGWAGGPAEPT